MNGSGGSLSVMLTAISCLNNSANCTPTLARSTWLCLPAAPKNIQITFLCAQNVIYFKTRLSPHRLNEMHNVEHHKKTFLSLKHFFSIRAITLSGTAEHYNRQIWSFSCTEANLFSLRWNSDEKSTILHDKFSPAVVILIGKLNLKNSRTTFCVLVYSTVFCIVSQPFTQNFSKVRRKLSRKPSLPW